MTEPSSDTRIYSADSQLRRPRQFVRATTAGLRAAVRVAPKLTTRGLRSQYRTSFLGYFWIVGPSIAVTVVWLYLDRSDVINGGQTSIPYGVYVLVGTLLWMSFSEAVNTPVQQLTNSANLLAKISFPAESLQLAGMATVVVNALARLLLTVPVFAVSGVRPSMSLVLFPIGLVALLMLGFAIGLMIAPFGALYRDVVQSVTIAMSFLFLVTPVAYSIEPGQAPAIARLNPITPMLETARSWLTGGEWRPEPGWYLVVALSSVVFVLAWLLLRLAVPHLVDRISS